MQSFSQFEFLKLGVIIENFTVRSSPAKGAARGTSPVWQRRAERQVRERYVAQVTRMDWALLEAVSDGVLRRAGVMLLARQRCLIGGGYKIAAYHQCRPAVVVEGPDAEDWSHEQNER
jgi:hypothetical protein